MTYCVALRLDRGLVFAADTRTSAGNDNVAHYRKLHYWRRARRAGGRAGRRRQLGGDAVGDLAAQRAARGRSSRQAQSLFNVPSLYRAARLVRSALRRCGSSTARRWRLPMPVSMRPSYSAGRSARSLRRLFHIYPEGNFIEATDDTPYFQIGEHKYGKPIIDQVAQPSMRLGEAAKLVAVIRLHAIEPFGGTADRPRHLRARQPRCSARERIAEDDEYFPQSCPRRGRTRCARRLRKSRSSNCSCAGVADLWR